MQSSTTQLYLLAAGRCCTGSANYRRCVAACPAAAPITARRDRKQPEKVPDGFDYDFWLGPAPQADYAPARCHVNFRWIYDYSGGQVTDWGARNQYAERFRDTTSEWRLNGERTGAAPS